MKSGFLLRDGLRHAAHDALGKREDALVRRRAKPAQRQRDLGLAFDEVESGEMPANRRRELVGIDCFLADIGRLQHLQIAPRQERAGIGDGAGVAGKLHAVFGSAQRRGADAFAGRQQRPGQRAGVEALAHRVAEPASHVAEVAVLAAVDVFADAARDHDAVDPAKIGDRLGQIERLERRRQRPHRIAAMSASAMYSATWSSAAGSALSPLCQ